MGPFNLWAVAGAVALFLLQQVATFLLKDWLERHKDQLRRALNLKLFIVGFDLFVVVGLVWLAFELFNNKLPALRQDLLLGLGMQTMLIIAAFNLIEDLDRWIKAVRAKAGVGSPPAGS